MSRTMFLELRNLNADDDERYSAYKALSCPEWRPLPGFDGLYEVSSEGEVRSVDREVTKSNGVTARHRGVVLRAYENPHGRLLVYPRRNGRRTSVYVHHAVAEAFHGPRPEGMKVLHDNGQSVDNRAVNLYYGTSSQNTHDSVRHGTHHFARRTHCSNGHEFTPENTRARSDGGRRCLTCEREKERARVR